ncbi:hypothetical protein [Pseudovibrio sp. Tun.PSC04-5.I4]|uniref:hypothetical protein n=1 Tax=Pseudovibrio sp. Tun.PSC04-5.I4 TaxID=1798213 RepID=UPI00087F8DE0|nr:hypothetical protein [Pseudovibrio sp. Tun.PSC04-5.I4]SDR10928.1 hypothetical protein SAMN04515695_2811 [Pseudovibrio sp. Tun.PSC04-5.I4]
MSAYEFDLLGDTIPEGFGGRGRSYHKLNYENSRLINLLLEFWKTQSEISSALGNTKPTLCKNYFRQLKVKDDARARVEAKCLGKLMDLVDAGNVAVIKEYFVGLERAD